MNAMTVLFQPVRATAFSRDGPQVRRLMPIVGETSKSICGDFPFKINTVTF
jgi:hypothetical protein